MAAYEPIYLTNDETEQTELGKGLDVLSDYLPAEKDVQVYMRRSGDIIEIRPIEGSLESLTIMSVGVSGARPRCMAVSGNGNVLEITLNNYIFHVYFAADENPVNA